VDQSTRFGKARVYIVRLRTDRHQARQGSGIQRCSRHQTDPVDNRVTDLVMRRPQKQVCVQPRPLAVNTALPAFAAERRAAPRATAAQLTASRRPNCIKAAPPLFQPGQIDEQTDGRTPYCYIDPASHTMRAVPAANNIISNIRPHRMQIIRCGQLLPL